VICACRVLACRHAAIAPAVKRGEWVLVSAHGNRSVPQMLTSLSHKLIRETSKAHARPPFMMIMVLRAWRRHAAHKSGLALFCMQVVHAQAGMACQICRQAGILQLPACIMMMTFRCAHSHRSLRGIVKHLDNISDEVCTSFVSAILQALCLCW